MADSGVKKIHPRGLKSSVLECGVCGEQFAVHGEKIPRLLLCGHSFCHYCLTRLPIQAGAVVCPMDRQLTDIGPSGIWGLKKNFALIELMERLQLDQKCISGNMSSDMVSNHGSESNMESDLVEETPCDEDDKHSATLYCVVCCTNLCQQCAEATHFTKTLRRHRLMSLEDKPFQLAMCPLHQTHALEFVCLEDSCSSNPVMCYLCKEHGKHKGHKHSLFELESRKARKVVLETIDHAQEFLSQISEYSTKLDFAIRRVEGSTQLTTNQQGLLTQQHCTGTAESARICIHEYFTRLRENIAMQEEVALNTLQVHVRNMLAGMRVQQDKISSLQSHVSAASAHCNKVMTKNDISLLGASSEVQALSKMIDEQEHSFREQLTSSDHLEPSIPVTFTKDNRVHIGPKLEIRVVTLGLDGAGKTTLLFKLKQDEFMQPIQTIGFNVETVEYHNLQYTVWDVGGKHKLRPLWKHYYHNTQAIIFVVDSCAVDRFEEAHIELTKLMCEKDLREAILLVLANKQDLPGAVSCEELKTALNLHKLCCGRPWHALPCDARSGSGLEESLRWLSRQLVAAGALEVV